MITEAFEPILESLARHHQMNPPKPHHVEIARAGTGAGLLTAGVYGGIVSHDSLEALIAAAARTPDHAPALAWIVLGGLVLVFAGGLLELVVGVARSAGPRDLHLIAKYIFLTAGAGALLWYGAYLAGWPVLNLVLQGLYLWWLAAGATKLVLALRDTSVPQLPDPETISDLPMSGPASREQAHEAMLGGGQWKPPKFNS